MSILRLSNHGGEQKEAGAAAADAAAAVVADVVAEERAGDRLELGSRIGVTMVTVDVEASGRRSRALDHCGPAGMFFGG